MILWCKKHSHIDIVSCFYDSICTMLFTKTILLAACFLAKHTACTSRRKNKFQLHDVPNHDKWEMRMFLLKCLPISFQVWWNKIRSWFQTVYTLTSLKTIWYEMIQFKWFFRVVGWFSQPNQQRSFIGSKVLPFPALLEWKLQIRRWDRIFQSSDDLNPDEFGTGLIKVAISGDSNSWTMQICGDFEGFHFNSALFGGLVSWHLIFDYPNVPKKNPFMLVRLHAKELLWLGSSCLNFSHQLLVVRYTYTSYTSM